MSREVLSEAHKDAPSMELKFTQLRRLVENGHLDLLKVWYENVAKAANNDSSGGWCGLSKYDALSLCHYAAKCGNILILQWLRLQEPPCPWNTVTCAMAAMGGHIDVLQWLRSQDPPCPWDDRTSACAAEGGHLAVLQWVRTQAPPCEWDEYVLIYSQRSGHMKVYQWALENGCKNV